MNRAAVIEHLKATQQTLAKLLALIESSDTDRFVAHLYQARKQYRLVCERPNKGNKAVEREILALPAGAEPGLSRRLPGLGAPAAFSRSETIRRCRRMRSQGLPDRYTRGGCR
jgi:hypothetical protein